jgi:hypothetical protein
MLRTGYYLRLIFMADAKIGLAYFKAERRRSVSFLDEIQGSLPLRQAKACLTVFY